MAAGAGARSTPRRSWGAWRWRRMNVVDELTQEAQRLGMYDMRETYFSIDVETDGPIPGPHSMLSLGCVAFDDIGKEISSFGDNLKTLPDAQPDPETAKWWETQPDAWKACRENPGAPIAIMRDFVSWV